MANSRFRKLNEFLLTSGTGKKQSAFGSFLADADLNFLENAEVEMNLEIERGEQRNCDKTDLIGQPTKKRRRQFRFRYSEFTPHQAFKWIAYKEGAVTAPTGTAANEVQTLTRSGTVSGGTFPLSLTLEGRTGSTKQIAWNAAPAVIQSAIVDQAHSLGKIIKPGDVVVSGDWTSGIVLTFGKRLRNANLPLLTVGNGAITGGGTIVNTQTTAGGNKYHTAQRSADGSKPLFSFAMGDKGGSIATRKYGDAVVSQVDFNTSADNTNVEMIVTVDCHFIPGEAVSIVVPACVNNPSVLATDFRLQMNGTFENRDLVSDSVSLNDNVPTGAAHSFDDIDITRAFQRGDQPSQETNTEFFGDSNHPIYQLAEQEFVEDNEIEVIRHYGNPGNRFTIIAPETKIKPQGSSLEGFSGEMRESTVKINGTPFGKSNLPVVYEFYGDQAMNFLSV